MPHLFVALSSHGFGHLAQVSPIINALFERIPRLRLSLQSDLSEQKLQSRIHWPFKLIRFTPDVVLPMAGPTEILWDKAFQAYRDFHARWDELLSIQSGIFKRDKPDLLLADVPYLPLAAAESLDIPAMAFCSLNWVDILLTHPQAEVALSEPLKVMRHCYSSARWFIQPEPSIPMEWLPNRRTVGPVVTPGKDCRDDIIQAFDLSSVSRLVVVGLGGISSTVANKNWPSIKGVHWLVDQSDWIARPDVHHQEVLNICFRDLVCSADVFVTKPGYGAFTEAACCGTPVLNIAREGWAETPYLEAWLRQSTPFETISLQQLQSGGFSDTLKLLLEASCEEHVEPTGTDEVVDMVLPFLTQSL
jgi:hypothetical protein